MLDYLYAKNNILVKKNQKIATLYSSFAISEQAIARFHQNTVYLAEPKPFTNNY